MIQPVKVVYDCMIVLQAAAQPHRVHGTMRMLDEGLAKLCLSDSMLAELNDVFRRPELQAKFPPLTPEHAARFILQLTAGAEMHSAVPKSFSLPRDRKDEPYIDLAVAARAKFLVTWNSRHLTYLMKRDTAEGVDFCTRFPWLTILSPPDYLRRMEEVFRDRTNSGSAE